MYRETNSKGNKSEEELLTEYSYKALHKLIKSGMWKMYCNREFQIDRVEWSDDLRRMVGYKDKSDFPDLLESWSDLLHPEDHARVINGIDPVLRDVTGNTIFDEEYRFEYQKSRLSLVSGNRRCFQKRRWHAALFFWNFYRHYRAEGT